MTKLIRALLALDPLIVDAITFFIRKTVRITKCSKMDSFLFKSAKTKYN